MMVRAPANSKSWQCLPSDQGCSPAWPSAQERPRLLIAASCPGARHKPFLPLLSGSQGEADPVLHHREPERPRKEVRLTPATTSASPPFPPPPPSLALEARALSLSPGVLSCQCTGPLLGNLGSSLPSRKFQLLRRRWLAQGPSPARNSRFWCMGTFLKMNFKKILAFLIIKVIPTCCKTFNLYRNVKSTK